MRTPLTLHRLAVLAGLVLAASVPAAAQATRPNIVFIMSDDHGKQAISCYGSKVTSTPGIDRIAREGMRFDRSSVTNAICGPSRAVMLTGKHSHANGFATNDQKFDGAQQTFPKLLKAAGYRTEVVGKWHLESDPTGFDHWDVLVGQGDYWNPTFIADPFEPLTRFQTGARGQLDVISDNKDFMRSVIDAGVELFTPLDLTRIPNAAGLFPSFKTASWCVRDGNTYGIPLIWGDEPCVWDPATWDAPPAKYTDFADPKWAGALVMVDDPIANTWLWARSLGHPEPNRLTQAELDETIDAMLATKPNVVAFAATLGDQADILIRGDASMAIGGWAYQIMIAKDKGVTLASGSPEVDGTFFWSDAYSIALDAPNLDTSYAFIDYMMSAEANAAIASRS